MKKNKGKYMEVPFLPKSAMTVADYAKSEGFTTNYVYNLIKNGKYTDKFDIVIFRSFNFIIPK